MKRPGPPSGPFGLNGAMAKMVAPERLYAVADGRDATGNWYQGLPAGSDWPTTLRRSLALQYFREWVAVAKPHGANTYTGSEQRFWSEITKIIPRPLTVVKDVNGNRCVTVSFDELRSYLQAYRRGEPND